MTAWSTPALLLFGIVVGPYGLNLLTPSILSLLDPGVAMALAMLGVFVGLSFDPGSVAQDFGPVSQPLRDRATALFHLGTASALRTVTTVAAVGSATLAAWWWLNPGSPVWLLALMFGVCAAVSDAAADDVNVDDVLMIVAGSLVMGALRTPSTGSLLVLALALAGIAVMVAVAGWLLVGQTNSEGEQHVFVVGSLLLVGGAATYLSLSAVFAGLVAGLVWNIAGDVAKARIIRDLHYFQHPLVVLVLVVAGAAMRLSVEAVTLAVIFVAVRSVSRPIGGWLARHLSDVPFAVEGRASLISAGLVGIALAVDVFGADARPEWGATLLGAVVIGTVVSDAVALFVPARVVAR